MMLLIYFVAPVLGGAVMITLIVALVVKHRTSARALIVATGLICVVVWALAGLTTLSMHETIDEYVSAGRYGPPEVVGQYLEEWHESARLTARVGLVMGGLPLAVCALLWRRLRDGPKSPSERWMISGVVLTGLFCLWQSLF